MKRLLAAASFVAAFAVGPVRAEEQGNPAFATPGTQSASGTPASNQANVTDRNFARAAAAAGLSEVDLGRLADQKGQSLEVRAFGQRMADDHAKANNQLKGLAAAASIPLPDAPSADDQAMRQRLDNIQGETFDLGYIRGQISAHQQAVQLFEYEIGSGQDSQLKSFAAGALPVLMQHLEMAQNIDAQLTGAGKP